jgi:two-component system chemotaxis response regulator CheY
MRILVAEDDPVSRKILIKTVEAWGHQILAAENGLEAWQLFQQENPKFVIADWLMPELDGVELCKKIRASETSGYIYFILLTGKGQQKDIVEGLQAGADDYLTKPFDIDELRVRIRVGERILNLEKELNSKNQALERLNEQLETLAQTDALMNIGNRRAFYETIQRVHQRSCRYPNRYGIIMIDIDNFKNYNDSYGHAAGDEALRAIAATLKSSIRCSDEIFRWGGEEIVLVIMEQSLEQTLLAAEKLRGAVAALEIPHKGCDRGYMTVSCGAAAFKENCTDKEWETVLERADQALYRAKESGRDRVCAGETGVPSNQVPPKQHPAAEK